MEALGELGTTAHLQGADLTVVPLESEHQQPRADRVHRQAPVERPWGLPNQRTESSPLDQPPSGLGVEMGHSTGAIRGPH